VYVVPQITIEESPPSPPDWLGEGKGPADPAAPIVTAPKAVLPFVCISKFLKPPAPPPPPPKAPPPPPPATIKVFTNLVPGCVVTALGVLDVFVVTVFLPRDVTFVGPIIPPLPAII
jgi:hypothetical protein